MSFNRAERKGQVALGSFLRFLPATAHARHFYRSAQPGDNHGSLPAFDDMNCRVIGGVWLRAKLLN